MKYILLRICTFMFKILSYPFVLLPISNKITLMSRMSNNKTLDISLLEESLKINFPNYKIVVLTDYFGKKIMSKIKYLMKVPKYLFHMYTSKIVICDCYIPVVSLTAKKRGVTIIQMWHASGAYKKFGYSSLDTFEGSSSKTAKILKMHQNYDYVLASSHFSKDKFSEAFNIDKSKIIISLLPRYEYLMKNASLFRDEVMSELGLNNGKQNILYAPTFRKAGRNYFKDIINNIDYHKYNLIIKKHGGKELIYIDNKKVYESKKNYDLKLLCASDIVITDYSAITFDALALEKIVYFYVPDYDTYIKERGIYATVVDGEYYQDIKELFKNIDVNKKIDGVKYIDLESHSIIFYINKVLKGDNLDEEL